MCVVSAIWYRKSEMNTSNVKPNSTYSIRRRLMLGLGILITVASVIETWVAYDVALREVDGIADTHMAQMARALRRDRFERSSPHVPSIDNKDEAASFKIQITPIPEGELPFPLRENNNSNNLRGFSIREIDGKSYRIYTTYSRSNKIEVMHDMALRSASARELALRIMLPFFIISPLMLLCVWLGVSLSLRPLFKSRNEIGKRDANDLSPLSVTDVPLELLPFVDEINALFVRVSNAFIAQKNFVADAAHELRSPLAALRLQVQGLQKAATDDARSTAAERLTSGIDRASRLVEQMLILAREESAELQHEEVDLAALTRLAISDVLPFSQMRGIDIGAKLPLKTSDNAGKIIGNPEALRIMLCNILDNAVKYAPLKGVVDVSLLAHDQGLELCIEDNGPGLGEEDRQRIFERFHRSPETSSNTIGSGLGMAIVKAIADRHRITISFHESTDLGGLAVTLRFP